MIKCPFACWFGFVLILSGCGSSKLLNHASLNLKSIRDWPLIYQNNYQLLKSVYCKTRLTIESSELSTNVSAKLIYVSPNDLYLKAEGLLGLDIGEIFIGDKRFIIYNQYDNQFIAGYLDEDYYNTFLQTDLTFQQIKNAVIGYVPLPSNLKLVDESDGIFSALVENNIWRFKVEKKTELLRTFEVVKNNQVILKEEFTKYKSIKGVMIPTLIRIILPQKLEMVSFFHKDLVVNDAINFPSYKIEIGPKVKQLIVGN
jgi:hypothetical protein